MKKSLVLAFSIASGGLVALIMLYVGLLAAREATAAAVADSHSMRSTDSEVCQSAEMVAGNVGQSDLSRGSLAGAYSPQQATPTGTPSCQDYNYTISAGTMISATHNIGNYCDYCYTTITLPFSVDLYGQTFTTAKAGSKGYLAFGTAYELFDVRCLPFSSATYVMAPFWVDQWTADSRYCDGCGIYTETIGTAPNRTFIVEFRTFYAFQHGGPPTLDYEIQMFEGQHTFKYVYGLITSYDADSALTIGVQKSRSPAIYTEYFCDPLGRNPPPIQGQQLTWTYTSCGVATATPTVTSTATPTVIPPTVTATPTCQDYSYGLSAGTMISGTYDIGNHCDFCYTTITLPFSVDLYGQTFTTAKAGSKGYLAFGTAHSTFDIECLPWSNATYMMAPFWVDQYTAQNNCTGCGIYTATIGTAPNRTFIVEYRTRYFNQQDPAPTLDYEIQLFEGSSSFRYAYGLVTSYANTDSALTIGVQKSSSPPIYTRLYCDPSGHSPPAIQGLQVMWYYASCGQATATATPFATSAPSFTPTATPFTPGPTNTSGGCFSGGRIPVSCTPTPTSPVVSTATPTATPSPTCRPDWYVAPGPDTSDARQVHLTGVAIVSADDIWAVGWYQEVGPPYNFRTYTIHWDGSSWTHVPSANYGTERSYLLDVAARTSSDVWAVGYYQSSDYQAMEPLTIHWDGASWTLVFSPAFGGASTYLESVAIVAANDVWAVGDRLNDTSVTLHWNGTSWQAVQNGVSGFLYGVSALASNDVWAVGYGLDNNCLTQAIIAHWNGQQWSVMPGPNPSPTNRLYGIYARASNDIWAVGTQSPYCNGGGYMSLILHWDGTTWTSLPGNDPDPGFLGTIGLYSVVALASDDAWAVGDAQASVPVIIKHWNGLEWSTVAQPNPTGDYSKLGAIAAVAPNDIWAVGTTSLSHSQPLINRFNPCWVASPTPTVPPCPIQFTDVPPGSTFYDFVRCLACRGIIDGYSDGTFRPNNNVTRGQLAKIVANSAGWSEPCTEQTFQDVPPGSTFFDGICHMGNRGYISGYQCGGPGEPCVPPNNLPYFRPGNTATRGQIAKIVSNAAGLQEPIPSGQQTFQDAPPGSTFFDFIERLASRGVMQGYVCGGPGEPCIAPENRPYFRPNSNATRGQTSKIVANTFFPACQTPGR